MHCNPRPFPPSINSARLSPTQKRPQRRTHSEAAMTMQQIAAALAFALASLPFCFAQQPNDTPHVTFVSADTTALRAVLEVGQQTRQPLGIIFGANPQKLCEIRHAFNIRSDQPRDALDEVLGNTGYSIEDDDGVLVLIPPDLMSWQQTLLDYRYESFPQEEPVPMTLLAARLTEWMWAAAAPMQGYGASIMYSPDAEKVQLGTVKGESTEEIANQIVKLGSKGVWMLQPNKGNSKGPTDEQISVYSYHDDAIFLPRLTCGP